MSTFLLTDGLQLGHLMCFYLMVFLVWVGDRFWEFTRMCVHTYAHTGHDSLGYLINFYIKICLLD